MFSFKFFFLIIFCYCIVLSRSEEARIDPTELLEKARVLSSKQQYNEALQLYNKALPYIIDPIQQIQVHSKCSELYWITKKYEMALESLKIIKEKDPSRKSDLKRLSEIELRLGKFEEAIDTLKLYKKQFPKEIVTPSLTEVENAHKKLTKIKDSYTTDPKSCFDGLKELISTYAPDASSIRLLRAECGLAIKQQKIASVEIKYVLDKDPNNSDALALYAKYLYMFGAPDKSKSVLKKCLDRDPESKTCMTQHKQIKAAERILVRAQIRFEEKKFDESIKLYKQYLKDYPGVYNQDEIMGKICNTYLEKKDNTNGIKECNDLINRMEKGSEALQNTYLDLAELYLLEDDGFDLALKSIQSAEEAGSTNRNRIQSLKSKVQRLKQMASRKDYYKILGVSKSASANEIKKAYRKKAIENHPDRIQGEENKKKAEKAMQDISEAYEVLSDTAKRQSYDNGEDLNQQGGFQHQGGFPGGFHGFPGGGQWNFQFNDDYFGF